MSKILGVDKRVLASEGKLFGSMSLVFNNFKRSEKAK